MTTARISAHEYVPLPGYFRGLAILNGQIKPETDEDRELIAFVAHVEAALENRTDPNAAVDSWQRKVSRARRHRAGASQ